MLYTLNIEKPKLGLLRDGFVKYLMDVENKFQKDTNCGTGMWLERQGWENRFCYSHWILINTGGAQTLLSKNI